MDSQGLGRFIKTEFPEIIKNTVISDSENYHAYGSYGAGAWASVPWMAICDTEVTESTRFGYYLAYVFKSDMSGFYLVFIFGTKQFEELYSRNNEKHYKRNRINCIEKTANDCNNFLKFYFDDEDLNNEMDLVKVNPLTKSYKSATICCKYYDKDNIPSDDILINDLQYYLELYRCTKNNYQNHTFIFKEDWVEILENNILSSKMIDVLKIINGFEDKTATTKQISALMAELGFDEKSYNSLIASNGKNIKQYLRGSSFFESNKDQFWNLFFYGKNDNTQFRFKLKDELIYALDNYNSKLDTFSEKNNHYLNSSKVLNDTVNPKDNNLNIDFYNFLIERGFFFDKETIENYLLSLKVKPFTILTGNSGTGKTKLSQLFSEYLTNNIVQNNVFNDLVSNTQSKGNYIDIEVKLSTIIKNQECSISKEQLDNYIDFELYQGRYSGTIDGIPANFSLILIPYLKFGTDVVSKYFKHLSGDKINIKINIDDIKDFLLETTRKDVLSIDWRIGNYPEHKQRPLKTNDVNIFLSRDNSSVPCEVIFEGKSIKSKFYLFIMQNYINDSEEATNYINNVLAFKDRDDKFNITLDLSSFISTFKKSDFNKCTDFKSNIGGVIDLHRIVPVGANWTENRNILGYYNLITESYQSTPAFDLIHQASSNLQNPYFLILDEMNLSHVERYFADFLSAIESGDAIPLYGDNINNLVIPENLFVIGTVNVDETTYMFSPKVLDRANVLEFKTGSSKDYMLGEFNLDGPKGDIDYLENPLSDLDIRSFSINDLRNAFKDVTVNGEDFWNILSDEIVKFQNILKPSGFDFGFRVINEIVRFMLVAWKYENKTKDWNNWERYFDAQIKQKILPKLHGSEKVLGDTLDKLAKACESEDGIKYSTSIRKLSEMINVLNKQRYVSFIN